MKKKNKNLRKSSKASWGAAKALIAKDERQKPATDYFRGSSRR